MSALVVCGRGPGWSDVMLYRACRRAFRSARLVRACDLSASADDRGVRFWHGGAELGRPDVCFIRSLGPGTHEQLAARMAVLRAMEESGVLTINSVSALWSAKDKFSSLLALREAGFSIPTTYLTESSSAAYHLCEHMEKLVYKPLMGSLGFGSMLFEDRDLAFNIFSLLERHGCPLYVQAFLGDVRRELRALAIADELVACVEKKALSGAWKRNVAQGGQMIMTEAPPGLEELCLRALRKLGLFYAGIDVLEMGNGRLVALEANASPNWRGLQKATGLDIAELLVERALEELRK